MTAVQSPFIPASVVVNTTTGTIAPIGTSADAGASVQAAAADHTHTMAHGIAVLALGRVTVAAPQVTADSVIMLTVQSLGGTLGLPYVSARTPGTGFQIGSLSLLDSSTVAWTIIG
jgi:hypothetical protein